MKFSTIAIVGMTFLGFVHTAHAQSGPPDPEVRALRQTNSELMQAWVGARTALAQTQDQLAISQHKVEELQTIIPGRGTTPMTLPNKAEPAATPPAAPPAAATGK